MPEKITLNHLQKALTQVAKRSSQRREAVRAFTKMIDDEANHTTRTAEGIGYIGVDGATIAETFELANIMRGLSKAAVGRSLAGSETAQRAQAAHNEAHTTHAGIQEAYRRSPADTSNLKREWLRQE